MTEREVTLLRDFITWQSLPFVDNVFSTRDETIKHFNEWLIQVSGEQQSSEDCISRESVRELICQNNDYYGYSERFHEFTEKCLQLPPVTSQRLTGEWIEYKVDIAPHPLHCSLCGFSNHHISNRYMREFRRCPNCGAEMSGGGEDGE